MATATITTKGQVTIPAEVRQRLGVASGDRIEFIEIEGGYAIKPAIDDVRSLKGLLRKPPKPVTLDDMNAAIRARGGGR
jgi:antitoxin PrlF